MAQIANIKKMLINSLREKLETKGFLQSKETFYRKNPIGSDMVTVMFLRDPLTFKAIVNVSIRYDALEKIYSSVEGIDSDSSSATIGAELGKLSGGETIMWDISNSSNIGKVTNDIWNRCQRAGFSFFDKNSSFKEIFDLLLDDNELGPFFCTIPHIRAKKALAASCLLQQDAYENILDRKIVYLQSIENPYMPDFLKFALKLKKQFADY